MIQIFNCEQGTDEWLKIRAGIPTASEFSSILAKGRGGEASKTRLSYLRKLADEVVYGDPVVEYTNANMERGQAMEAEARSIYALTHGVELERVGFVRNGSKGCSPDSLIGKDGLLEVKTTFPRLLVELQLNGEFPEQHKAQCQGALWVTERDYVDLIVYWPKRDLYVKRAYRDDGYIANLAGEVDRFNDELAKMVEQYKRRIGR